MCYFVYCILNEKESGPIVARLVSRVSPLIYTVSTQQAAYNTRAGRPSLSIHIFIEGIWQRIDGASSSLCWSVIDEAQHQEEEGKEKKQRQKGLYKTCLSRSSPCVSSSFLLDYTKHKKKGGDTLLSSIKRNSI